MRALITSRTLFDKNRQPIRFGKMLVESFQEQGTVLILSDDPSQTEIDLVTHGLDHKAVSVYPARESLTDIENVSRARHESGFDCLIDSDPALITWAYSQGINSLLALEPKFMDPRFRPDGPGVVSWAHLVDEIESQTRMLAQKRTGWETSGFNAWE